MMKKFFTPIIFSFTILILSPFLLAHAQNDSTIETQQAHSVARLVSEHVALYAGETYYLGLDIKLDPKWHTYWINPGDSASASIFKFKPVPGITFGDPIYPTPTRYKVGPFYSFGYEDRVLIQFPVEITKRSQHRQIPIELSAEWLVCQEECIPAFFDFKVTLPSPPPAIQFNEIEKEQIKRTTTNAEYKDLFHQTRLSWPQKKLEFTVLEHNDSVLEISFPKVENIVDIFPYPHLNISNAIPELLESEQDGFLKYRFKVEKKNTTDHNPIQFLLSFTDEQGNLRSHTLTTKSSSSALNATSGLGLMLLFGLLGGLILNLMPCVFPVLMLKVFQVVHSHQEGNTKNSLIFYVLGILVSFWILAFIILILQSAGHLIGWGFQLQSVPFTAFLTLLFVLMALYFLDLLPLPNFSFLSAGQKLTRRQDNVGAFFTGVLAVIVASPCTAPFMGAAMGYALSRSSLEVLAIFTSLGLGLGLPFLLLAFFPRSLSWLPKPGTWMVYFKKLMALPLLATAIWLAWVMLQQLSPPTTEDGFWSHYTPEVADSLKTTQPVFVNFTASWCISCQVNERVAFQDSKVREFISKHNIKMLKADWTKKSPEIAQVLKFYGRAGVPMYLFFTPPSLQPVVLPELLTPQILIQHLKENLNIKDEK